MWLAVSLVSLLLVGLAAVAHYAYWTRALAHPLPYAEEHRLATDDGSAIELRRVPRTGTSPLPPLLLVHGVGANHRNLDPDERSSLARLLASRGRDVWLLTLRSGRARHPWRERPALGFAPMAAHDVPLAVKEVLARTKSATLDYVGFSMGGMLLYAALGRTVDAAVLRRVVIIGSPGKVAPPWRVLRVFRGLPRWLVPRLPFRELARALAFCIEWVRTPVHGLVLELRNVPKGAARRAMVNMIEDVPSRLAADLTEWALGDGELRVAGERGIDHLRGLRVPVRFFAGSGDRLGAPELVAHGFDAWGADAGEVDKEMKVLGRATGCAWDYGHGDLCIGTDVGKDVNEPAASFLCLE